MTDSPPYRLTRRLVLLATLLLGSTVLADADVEGALEICRQQCLPQCVELADLLDQRNLMQQQVQAYRQACSSAPRQGSGSSKDECLRAASEHFQGSVVEGLCRQPTRGTAECIREAAKHFSTADAISQLCSRATPGTGNCIREAAVHFSTVDPISQVCAHATRGTAACVREASQRFSTADAISQACSSSGGK